MSILSLNEWDEFISNCPEAHLLQTGAWGELKVGFGWEPVRLLVDNGDIRWGAQVLFRQLPLGLTLAYIPKGPLFEAGIDNPVQTYPRNAFWSEINRLCQRRRAVFLKVEPDDYFINHDAWEKELPEGFHCSSHSIQPRRTIVVDLRGSEDDILSRMKQKTRYNIRLAARKGVSVRPSADVDVFFRLMQTTGERDQFGIHTLEYYQKAFNLFKSKGACELLLAEFEGEPLAVLMVFASGKRSWYLYGASASLHRELMPTYLLQWEAMKWARSVGCTEYDLWGVPDYDQEILEAEFNKRSDGMWGIYRFKRGFGGTVHRSIGVWDRVYKPFFYKLYLRWVNKDGNR
jgi:lipid II:glycine glycyltransferase (peptidoglycan interpeptide bridge formation enzyme)